MAVFSSPKRGKWIYCFTGTWLFVWRTGSRNNPLLTKYLVAQVMVLHESSADICSILLFIFIWKLQIYAFGELFLFVSVCFIFPEVLFSWFHFIMQVFASPSVSRHYFHQMALCMKEHVNVLPPDIEIDLPGYASLLGNLLEVARLAFALPESFTMVKTCH